MSQFGPFSRGHGGFLSESSVFWDTSSPTDPSGVGDLDVGLADLESEEREPERVRPCSGLDGELEHDLLRTPARYPAAGSRS